MIKIVKGNVLEAKEGIIVHQVNTLGIMGAGLALSINKKYPHVFAKYREACKSAKSSGQELLGKIQILSCDENDKQKTGQCVCNLFAQCDITRGNVNTDLDALRSGFKKLNRYGRSVAIPYKIGCGLGGGAWNDVIKLIEEELTDIDVTIYSIDGYGAKGATVTNLLVDCFEGAESFTLKEAEQVILDSKDVKVPSIRARVYEGLKSGIFTKLSRGVYSVTAGGVTSLFIHGNGRDLSFLDDNSVDAIITDHPYDDANAHKGGNRDMASYETFRYTQQDMEDKFRVLKPGSFLVEFMPEESATNYDYLYNIKKMAAIAGFKYYAKVGWKKGTFIGNTGRKSKNVEDVVFFSKKDPRCLRQDAKKNLQEAKLRFPEEKLTATEAYSKLKDAGFPVYYMKGANKMLPTQFDVQPPNKANRIHQAEKPVELLRAIIELVTLPGEVILDQFSGSGVLAEAAIETGRHSIIIELDDTNKELIVERLDMSPIECAKSFQEKESN